MNNKEQTARQISAAIDNMDMAGIEKGLEDMSKFVDCIAVEDPLVFAKRIENLHQMKVAEGSNK